MTNITASLVKELRDKTGAGMMDCKNALNENNGDIESSIDWLRTKGLAKAAKKSGRTASEGLIVVSSSDDYKSILEVNSETDFVARNETFQEVARNIGLSSLLSDDIDSLNDLNISEKEISVKDYITEMIASIGENINLRRMKRLSMSDAYVSSYIHGQVLYRLLEYVRSDEWLYRHPFKRPASIAVRASASTVLLRVGYLVSVEHDPRRRL